MENLEIYNILRSVPEEAKKTIGAGRLKGFTDINPMWRIKVLTETFGMVGFGWKYKIIRQWMEQGGNGVISCFSHIELYVKHKGEWSEAIEGVGGSSFVAMEKSGACTSDECYKMALTDALSIACKALGVGADVYFEKDRTKYDNTTAGQPKTETPTPSEMDLQVACDDMRRAVDGDEIRRLWNANAGLKQNPQYKAVMTQRVQELGLTK